MPDLTWDEVLASVQADIDGPWVADNATWARAMGCSRSWISVKMRKAALYGKAKPYYRNRRLLGYQLHGGPVADTLMAWIKANYRRPHAEANR